MTKIIFFDIDGTLLSFRTHQVPQSTIEAVRKARRMGIKIWIATGRPLSFVSNLGELEYDGLLCVNGGHCRLQTNEQKAEEATIIYTKPIDPADIERMVDEQRRNGLAIVYAGTNDAFLAAPNGVPESVTQIFTLLDIKMPRLAEPEEALGMDILELNAFYEEPDRERIMGDILKSCNETRWHPVFADCIPKGTNKATGIDQVIRHYGFDISETMAFGDGENDIEMLQHAGIGVAMGNASDAVKAAADIVTDSVDDNGVANILNRFVINQE